MKCPQCGAPEDNKVIESRPLFSMNINKRRRECKYCGHRFTTYELIATEQDKKKSMLRGVASIHRKEHGRWELKYIL